MNVKQPILSLAFLCLYLCSASARQNGLDITRIGETSSFKGHSISVLTTNDRRENSFLRFTATLDTYGMLSDRTTKPGVKASVTYNTIVRNGSINEDIVYIVYLGAGGVTGYLKDYYKESVRNHGVILGIAPTVGGMVAFRGTNIELGLDFTAEVALQLRRMEETSSGRLGLSWYANGLLRALIPQVSIYYRF